MIALITKLAPLRYLILAAVVFMAGWTAQGWRLNVKIAEMREDQATAAREFEHAARVKEQGWNAKLQEAKNAAKKRETKLRSDAVAVGAAADRLRNELDAGRRRLPDLAVDAARQRADILAQLLGACQNRYRSMAEEADRIEGERRELIEAWPK